MRLTYPIPANDTDFEILCCQLLKKKWNRPQLQRYAHSGEGQEGVDIHDPSQTQPVHGAQCKLHGYGKSITPNEIEDEVEKAKGHTPRLDIYAILTTGKKSKKADRKVAEINVEHKKQRLFEVVLLTWDQIEGMLDENPEIRDPVYIPHAIAALNIANQAVATWKANIETTAASSSDAIDAELDGVKTETERHEYRVAFRLSERIEEKYGNRLSPRQRWRLLSLRANIHLQEGDFNKAAGASPASQDIPARRGEGVTE